MTTTTAHPLLVDGTFTISAHSLAIADRCARAFHYYRIDARKAVRAAGGLLAGTALHAAIAVLQAGGTVAAQEQAISNVLAAAPPLPPDDHRTPGYLRDALAAFRAEFVTLFTGWTIEEQETQGTVELGTVQLNGSPITVLWEFRRDVVGIAPEGLRFVVDWKTASRDEDAHYLAMKNSGQFMGYLWSWNTQHPDRPAHGVLPVRIILRRPSRTGVSFSFPHDPPILFQPERIAEWHRHTLAKVRTLLSRDPANLDDWPLACAELGLCRTQFGVCEYLAVCSLKPGEDRARMLASDAYEPADADKPALSPAIS